MSGPQFGQAVGTTDQSEYNTLFFAWQMFAQKMQTATLVRVTACTNDGGLAPVGTVDVQPLVNQMTGDRVSVPHGTIFRLPYMRIQGGANAVIIDPVAGDLGMAAFASRDISAVKTAKAPANPGSLRMFDWADGLYLGGFLNGVPTSYVAFTETGIEVTSPVKITLTAPSIVLAGAVTGNSTAAFTGDVTAGTISLENHIHPQTGGPNTDPPVP